jgi:hypothetical protein
MLEKILLFVNMADNLVHFVSAVGIAWQFQEMKCKHTGGCNSLRDAVNQWIEVLLGRIHTYAKPHKHYYIY